MLLLACSTCLGSTRTSVLPSTQHRRVRLRHSRALPAATWPPSLAAALQDVKNHSELDSNFEKLRLAITQHVGLLQRQAQVRVKNWLKKLSEEVRLLCHFLPCAPLPSGLSPRLPGPLSFG